jgi:hypothetical protein
MIAHGWKAVGYEDAESIKGSRRSMDLALRGILRSVSSKCRLHFYFITGEDDARRIRDESILGELRRAAGDKKTSGDGAREVASDDDVKHSSVVPPTNITFTFLPLDEAQLAHWMAQIGHVPTHRTGAAGNVKFFYPQLLPSEEKVLMLDSDILVDRDICELWEHFHFFPKDQLFAFAPQKVPMHVGKDNQFNAGVALLHLERMRKANWLALARRSIAAWDAAQKSPKCCAHGDQSVFHMVRWHRPLSFQYVIPRWWNLNKCHGYMKFEQHHRRFVEMQSTRAPNTTTNKCWFVHDISDVNNRSSDSSNNVVSSRLQGKGFSELTVVDTSLHDLQQRQHNVQRYVMDGTRPTMDEDDVFVGIVHLGCCKKCTRGHLRSSPRWQRLLSDIEAFDLSALRSKMLLRAPTTAEVAEVLVA